MGDAVRAELDGRIGKQGTVDGILGTVDGILGTVDAVG